MPAGFRFSATALVAAMAMSATLLASDRIDAPQQASPVIEHVERIQREAATFTPGDSVEVVTDDGRRTVGIFESATDRSVLFWVPGRRRGDTTLQEVSIADVRALTPPRLHIERQKQGFPWLVVITCGFLGLILAGIAAAM
jgi:hypothetical protein